MKGNLATVPEHSCTADLMKSRTHHLEGGSVAYINFAVIAVSWESKQSFPQLSPSRASFLPA